MYPPWPMVSVSSFLALLFMKSTTADDHLQYPVGSYTPGRRQEASGSTVLEFGDHGKAPQVGDYEDPRSECILLFGAFCNGNMGDVVQVNAMEDLLHSIAPDQCFWYGHPWKEDARKWGDGPSFGVGQFFGSDSTRVVPLDSESAPTVNRFKAMVIGGGGIFVAEHIPLTSSQFMEEVEIPVVVLGVGAEKNDQRGKRKAPWKASVQKFGHADGHRRPMSFRKLRRLTIDDDAKSDSSATQLERVAGEIGGVVEPCLRNDVHYNAKRSARLLEKAVFVSGRDKKSTDSFAAVLRKSENPVVEAQEVEMVRDPVLSCKMFSDTEGKCWKKSEGSDQPLCFVLPASTTTSLDTMHQHLVKNLVRRGDVFVNVFPKHQEEVVAHGYPGEVEEVLDPALYTEKLCSCRAIVSSRLHGAVLGLHMGVPTLGAWMLEPEKEHKVVDLMVRTMELPDQYVHIHENLTRAELEDQVDRVSRLYLEGDRRAAIQYTLERFHREFEEQASRVMRDILGIEQSDPSVQVLDAEAQWDLQMSPDARQSPAEGELSRAMGQLATPLALLAFIIAMAMRRQKQGPKTTTDKPSSEHGQDVEREVSAQDAPNAAPISTALEKILSQGDTSSVPRLMLAIDFTVWVSLAVGFSAYGKGYLRRTRDPAGLLTLQGVTGVAILAALGSSGAIDLDPTRELQNGVGGRTGWVGLLHTGQALLTNVAVLVGGVAVTNAVKALEPVAAALLSYLILGKHSSRGKMAAIAAIVMGITLLTWTSGGGGDKGKGNGSVVMISSFVTISAVFLNALRNVVLKMGQPVPSHVTLYVCSAVAALVGISMKILSEVIAPWIQHEEEEAGHEGWLQMGGVNAALCFVGYNFASFNILNYLSPVGHAVGNSCKRLMVFASGLIMLGEVMTARQFTGAVVALAGVMIYNLVAARS